MTSLPTGILAGIERDQDGYLKTLNDWNRPLAEALAQAEGIELSEKHWEILDLVRNFYTEYQLAPTMRALVNYTKRELGAEKGQSIYLQQLFPPNPALMSCKIAGLPRPANCF